MSRRIQRLNEELRREISDILRREIRDPRIGIPTVTRVEVTADLWLARVFVRVTGSDEERREAMQGLEGAAPFVRRALGGMRVRRVPEIRFEPDATLDHASRIEALLRDVEPASGWGEEPEAAEEAGEDAGADDDAGGAEDGE